jgi:hypothetical protein
MFKLKCQECGIDHESNWSGKLYCTDACRLKAWRKEQKSKKAANLEWTTCPGCGDKFPHKNPKKVFCTAKCKTSWHRWNDAENAKRVDELKRQQYTAPLSDQDKVDLMLQRAMRQQGNNDPLDIGDHKPPIIWQD